MGDKNSTYPPHPYYTSVTVKRRSRLEFVDVFNTSSFFEITLSDMLSGFCEYCTFLCVLCNVRRLCTRCAENYILCVCVCVCVYIAIAEQTGLYLSQIRRISSSAFCQLRLNKGDVVDLISSRN
jgi:hypothetical protein